MALKFKAIWIPAVLFVLFLIVTRFASLAVKPYHHDESLYAVESWRYATKGQYTFHPMLHGPFLFHFQAGLFLLPGVPVNDTTGRLPVAMAGLLFPLLGALILRRRGVAAVTTWFGACALSPIFCFFSRFLGMDLPMICLGTGLMAALYAFLYSGRMRHLHIAAVVAALMICTKLNFLFYFFAIGTFAVFWLAWDRWHSPEVFAEHKTAIWEFLKKHNVDLLVAFLDVVVIFCALYSSLGRNPGGILDGLYRKMFPYWAQQHQIQRIKGPFDYYFPLLAIYELPLLLAVGAAVVRAALSSASHKLFAWRGLLIAIGLFGFILWNWSWCGPFLSSRFHFDQPHHLLIALVAAWAWWLLMTFHMERGERLEAFAVHFGMVSLLLYSYAGEKIPWLTTHILLPWILYIAAAFPPLVREMIPRRTWRLGWGMALIAVVAWQGMITVRSSFALSADPRERLVYTHTSLDMLDLFHRIEKLAAVTGEGKDFKIQVVGDSAWPLYWYLRDYRRWFFQAIVPAEDPKVVVVDWEKRDLFPAAYADRYTMERYKLREWWVPDETKATWAGFVRYYLTRQVFSELGHQDIAVFIRHDLLKSWR